MTRGERMGVVAVAALAWIGTPKAARAGIYADDLGKCLVDSTTREDRNTMVRWIFTACAKHRAVKDIVSVSPEKAEMANKAMGELLMRLLTRSCREKTRTALQFEGAVALQLSFQVLGQVAGRELFSDAAVATSIAGVNRYLDAEKLKALAPGSASIAR